MEALTSGASRASPTRPTVMGIFSHVIVAAERGRSARKRVVLTSAGEVLAKSAEMTQLVNSACCIATSRVRVALRIVAVGGTGILTKRSAMTFGGVTSRWPPRPTRNGSVGMAKPLTRDSVRWFIAYATRWNVVMWVGATAAGSM